MIKKNLIVFISVVGLYSISFVSAAQYNICRDSVECDRFFQTAGEYHDIGMTDSAILLYEYCLKCYKDIGDDIKLGETFNKIAIIYRDRGDYNKSLEYFQDALDIHSKNDYNEGIAQTKNSIGILYMAWQDYDVALTFYYEALALFKSLKLESKQADVLNNIGLIYKYQNDFDNALNYFLKSLEIREKYEDQIRISASLHNIGTVYSAISEYELALNYFSHAYKIRVENNNRKEIAISLNAIGSVFLNQGLYDKAILEFQKAMKIAQEIQNAQMIITLYENLTISYSAICEFEKFRNCFDNYIGYYDSIYDIQKHQQIVEMQTQYETKNKEKEILFLNKELEFARISARKDRFIVVLLFSFLILFITLAIIFIRVIRLKSKIRLINNNQRLLRLQMNPHFIFNSLGAIQEYIYKENALKAGTYLSNFSKLMRSILEFSKKDYILLSEEIEMLEYYIELQKLRFKDGFKHIIKIDPEIDPDFVCIPPMLLQPFVENSIEHGLKKSDSDGEILIQIKSLSNNLEIQINDNGIGYEESQKNKTAHITHKSRAIEITNERLKALNKNKTSNTSVKFTSRESVGTTVFLKIPLIIKNIEK